MKGKTSAILFASLALSLAVPSRGFAQGKIRVAIWEFENHAGAQYWYSNQLGPAARNQIDNEFSENKLLSAKFSVVERDKLNLVLKEQGLATAGAVDPTTAAKVGKILGVKYVVMGGFDKFNVDVTKAAVGPFNVGGHMVQSFATISLRFVDTTTAERVVSISAGRGGKAGGGVPKGPRPGPGSGLGNAQRTHPETGQGGGGEAGTGGLPP